MLNEKPLIRSVHYPGIIIKYMYLPGPLGKYYFMSNLVYAVVNL